MTNSEREEVKKFVKKGRQLAVNSEIVKVCKNGHKVLLLLSIP